MKIAGLILALISLTACTRAQPAADNSGLASLAQQEDTVANQPLLNDKIRPAQVDGQFYPADAAELTSLVDKLLGEARASVSPVASKPRVLVLPHAGYEYSGAVAAAGFAQLTDHDYDTVIILTVNHSARFDGISIFDGDNYETPLGLVPIHRGFVQSLRAVSDRVGYFPEAEKGEHTIEVMLPFLQRALDFFTLVPISLSGDVWEDAAFLATTLPDLITDKTLLIASSDLSHYPDYEAALSLDTKTVQAIATGEPSQLFNTLRTLEADVPAPVVTLACGEEGIWTAMEVAKTVGANQIQILKTANSGDAESGDKKRVVGYAAISFAGDSVRAENLLPANNNKTSIIDFTGDNVLSNPARLEAIELVRRSMESFVRTGAVPEANTKSMELYFPLGAFVSLKKDGALRGSIGLFSSSEPLWKTLQEMAVAAVSEDDRFLPVTTEELPNIVATISILSASRLISDPRADILLGVHGVTVEKGHYRGTFLPQVATETGWILDEFMGELCSQKAGLPRDCWLQDDVNIYVYTVQGFGE